MSEKPGKDDLIPWDRLSGGRPAELRNEYGYYLDSLPPACSLETRVERFRRWLQERGADYRG